jgi:hypothetical protein
MKMTFIAEHGVEAASAQVGKVDYTNPAEFKAAVEAELATHWDPDSAVGYETEIALNGVKLDNFAHSVQAVDGLWVEHLVVPYGYLVLTK